VGGQKTSQERRAYGPFTSRQLTIIVCVAIVALVVIIPTAAMAASGLFTSTTAAPAVVATNSSPLANSVGAYGRSNGAGNAARTGVLGYSTGSNGVGVQGNGAKYGVFSNGPLGVAAGKSLNCNGCVGPGAQSPLAKGTMFAVVNLDGTLRRGTPGTHSAQFAGGFTGDYTVTFPRSVTSCAWVASVTSSVDGNNPFHGQVGVTSLSGNAKGLYVQGQDSAGTDAEVPFTVIVSCP
jgi:hypothetical protein